MLRRQFFPAVLGALCGAQYSKPKAESEVLPDLSSKLQSGLTSNANWNVHVVAYRPDENGRMVADVTEVIASAKCF